MEFWRGRSVGSIKFHFWLYSNKCLSVTYLQKAPKEPIPEEAELEFKPLEECEESLEEDSPLSETKETEQEAKIEAERKGRKLLSASPNICFCQLFLHNMIGFHLCWTKSCTFI